MLFLCCFFPFFIAPCVRFHNKIITYSPGNAESTISAYLKIYFLLYNHSFSILSTDLKLTCFRNPTSHRLLVSDCLYKLSNVFEFLILLSDLFYTSKGRLYTAEAIMLSLWPVAPLSRCPVPTSAFLFASLNGKVP